MLWLMLAGVCLGKQLYLSDGGIIECKSFRLQGDQVIVLVNRDTLLELERKEVDLRRSFRHSGKKSRQHKNERHDAVVTQPVATKTSGNIVASSVAVKPPVTVAAPTARPVAAGVPAVASKPVSSVPAAVASVATAASTTAPASATKEPARLATTANTAAEPAAPLDKAEIERRIKQSNEMMTEALRNNDRELMKKAMELQQSTVPQESRQQARVWGLKFILIVLICSLLIVVSMWFVFAKAGEPGWKSLVPFYNIYILMLIAGKPGWWFFLLLIPLVGAAVYLMAILALAERFGKGALFGIGLTFLPMFFFPLLAFGGVQIEEFQFGS